ncbi:hypothetical protein ACFPRL_04475 [Pseudoclavibacter helvolus]
MYSRRSRRGHRHHLHTQDTHRRVAHRLTRRPAPAPAARLG